MGQEQPDVEIKAVEFGPTVQIADIDEEEARNWDEVVAARGSYY